PMSTSAALFSQKVSDGTKGFAAPANGMLLFALVIFLLTCVFDPADRLFGLKVQLFLACWFIVALYALQAPGVMRLHTGLLVYVLLFLLIPTASIAWYVFWSGGGPFAGFQLLKGYLLVT